MFCTTFTHRRLFKSLNKPQMTSLFLFVLLAMAWRAGAQTDSEQGIRAPYGCPDEQKKPGNKGWAGVVFTGTGSTAGMPVSAFYIRHYWAILSAC